MSDKDSINRGEVKAFRQSFIYYSGDYPDGKLVSAVTIEDIDSILPAPHEMTAREFAKEFRRMCDSYDIDGCNECYGCKLYAENICNLDELDNIVPIVEQWAKEHPEKRHKTYAEDFFEKFPNAKKDGRGLPLMCRSSVYGGSCHFGTAERADCAACWNEVMED